MKPAADLSERGSRLQLAQISTNPRARMGGNTVILPNDAMTLQRAFPSLTNSPGGAILAVADGFFDVTSAASQATTALTEAQVNTLIKQIRSIDPKYRLDLLRFPETLDGQMNLLRQLRFDRAEAFYRVRDDIRPLQVETLRYLQERTDRAYEKGINEYQRGNLNIRLSRQEAVGNYIDRSVRADLKELYNSKAIVTSTNGPIRIIGREYASSSADLSYRIPDVRVGRIAFDVSLTRKTARTPQVRGFFNGDFRPSAVIIVRPSQLGPNSTYLITRPEN